MVFSAQFGKAGAATVVAAGSQDNELRVFDRESNDVVASVRGMKKSLYCLDVSADGSMISFGTADGLVNVLDYTNS